MSRYLNSLESLQRLRDEWKKYGKLIVAVDVDSTLIPYHLNEKDDNYEPIREQIRQLFNLGCPIIINTAAEEARWDGIKEKLAYYNIPWTLFNESPPNIPNIVKKGKVYANVYYDDRAGLSEVFRTMAILIGEKMLEEQANKNLYLF
jgi:hypothetical protein